MRFHTEHTFDRPVADVVGVLADPGFYLALDLPDVDRPELVAADDDGTRAALTLRFTFAGSVDPLVRRLVGADRLVWIQSVEVDRATASGTLGFQADKDPKLLHGSGRFEVVAAGVGSMRRLDGDLVVAVPGLGRMAERRLVPGITRRLDVEAEAVNDRTG